MTSSNAHAHTVIVCDDSQERTLGQDYLDTHGNPPASWIRPQDLDDLRRELSAERLTRVVFLRPSDFLHALWSGAIDPQSWLEKPVEAVTRRGDEWTDNMPAHVILAAWQAWRYQHRRSRVIAGVLLSLLALAAAFTVLLVT